MWRLLVACVPEQAPEYRSTPIDRPDTATETASTGPDLSCTPAVPEEATVVTGAVEVWEPDSAWWVCPGGELTVRAERVSAYLVGHSVAVMRGNPSFAWADREGSLIIQSSNVTAVVDRRASVAIEATGTNLIYCDALTYTIPAALADACPKP